MKALIIVAIAIIPPAAHLLFTREGQKDWPKLLPRVLEATLVLLGLSVARI